MIQIKNIIDGIILDFENSFTDLEALNSYFIQTRNFINAKKLEYDEKYDMAYKLSKILDTIYNQTEDKRVDYIQSIMDNEIVSGVKVKDMAEITLSEDKKLIRFLMREKYKKREFNPSIARKQMNAIYSQENIFARSILSNIIIVFEQYLSLVYEMLVLIQPQQYFKDKKMLICDIWDKDIVEVINSIIKEEVEKNMFDSLKTLDKIKEQSKIDVDRYIPIRKEFEEVYYRRNAYVHTQGTANTIYLKNVDKDFTKEVEDGDKLICDNIYLEKAILSGYKMICALHYELLQYNQADQEDYTMLSNYGFDALQNGNYFLAEYIYGILRRSKSFEYSHKIIYEINYMLALKLQGSDISELLRDFDVSIATDEYIIAKECLCDNHKKVYDMLTSTYPKSFDAYMIREWPLFIHFRESEYYSHFKQEHEGDFDTFDFENEG